MKRPEGGGGGGSKDFFSDRNEEFKRHKSKLLKEVEAARAKLSEHPQTGSVGFVKVQLQSAALAKSHRPMDAIFKPSIFPLVGSGDLGELYFEVTNDALSHAANVIGEAEEAVTKRNHKDELIPSAARSEVGAIERITVPSLNEKRTFTLEEAIDYFRLHPMGRYLVVELFVDESELTENTRRRNTLAALKRFRQQLQKTASDLHIWDTGSQWKTVHITVINFPSKIVNSDNLTESLHGLLGFLDRSTFVRRYSLGPIIARAATSIATTANSPANILPPLPNQNYPIIGIIDGGVTKKGNISKWCVGRLDFMDVPDEEREHGTFIAGLLVNGSAFNPGQPLEIESCKYFDFDIYSENEIQYKSNFKNGFIDMMRQLDVELKNKPPGLRIINMSLNPVELTQVSGYSYAAAMLDEISDKHDVIFVISAGNLKDIELRERWPTDALPALQQLASYRYQGADRLFVPGETARNLTVGALELMDADGSTRPARYSRRGPATSAGVKPDFGHIGGCQVTGNPLISLNTDGVTRRQGQGTSFAAPSVAKTLALLEGAIQGHQPRELLLGLMYHFAQLPKHINSKQLSSVAKDFVGFGMPATHKEMLSTDDHSITMLFADTLPPGKELSFDFSWPDALMKDGAIRGEAFLTVVCTPPLDRKFGAEFARVNIDAYLRQETINEDGEIKYKGRLTTENTGAQEKHMISHGAKWWPVKHYTRKFSRLKGTSNWRLVVDALTRAGTVFPEKGVNFAVLLTIADPKGTAPVFTSMRQALLNRGTKLRNVQTQVRAQAGNR